MQIISPPANHLDVHAFAVMNFVLAAKEAGAVTQWIIACRGLGAMRQVQQILSASGLRCDVWTGESRRDGALKFIKAFETGESDVLIVQKNLLDGWRAAPKAPIDVCCTYPIHADRKAQLVSRVPNGYIRALFVSARSHQL